MAGERNDMKWDEADKGPLPEDRYPKREDPNRDLPLTPGAEEVAEGEGQRDDKYRDPQLAYKIIDLAGKAFRSSTSFLDTSVRRTWEDNLRMFRSEHPVGSKYHDPSYKGRSNLFRPKTRSAIKNHEAAAAAALFSNDDLISLSAFDQNNPMQAASSKVHQYILQYRLENTIPWMQTVVGAYQDTHVYGICISRQGWAYEAWDDVGYEVQLDETGQPLKNENGEVLGYETRTKRVVRDEPEVVLIAPENMRFDPSCDWRDPMTTSPYLVEMIPMTAGDVEAFMEKVDPKTGKPSWFRYSQSQIIAAGQQSVKNETTRQAREGRNRQDPAEVNQANEFTQVWVHLNIIRYRGEDYVYWSIGENLPLTEPRPLREVFHHGRPYRLGVSTLEAHRNYPSSSAEQGASLQTFLNEMTNQRIDNVRLALNKRYFLKRQKLGAIDMPALMRNTPGGGVVVDDPEKDVKVVETRDVTGSAYQEQDRAVAEFDDLLGTFSQSSVLSNRALQETVGGMNLARSGANSLQELSIRLFIITWMIPVLRDLVRLEAQYETDETILRLAGEQAQLMERGQQLTDELLDQNLIVRVNVGMGHTNPAQKIEKLGMALGVVEKFPTLAARLNDDEIGKEIFGYVGFSDGARFLIPADQVQTPPDPKAELEARKLDLEERKIQQADEHHRDELALKERIEMYKIAVNEGIKMSELEAKLGFESQKNQTVRDMAAVREMNKSRELDVKETQGSGI